MRLKPEIRAKMEKALHDAGYTDATISLELNSEQMSRYGVMIPELLTTVFVTAKIPVPEKWLQLDE